MTHLKDDSHKNYKGTAIGLLSGGLDSLLAHKVVSDLGFKVISLNFKTPFTGGFSEKKLNYLRQYFGPDVEFRVIPANEDYVEVVKQPKHGYGKNINPCIDCKIYMLRRAKQIMEEEGRRRRRTVDQVNSRSVESDCRRGGPPEAESSRSGEQ